MRRPVLMAVLLAIALLSVIYGKYRLDQSIKEGFFSTEPGAGGEGSGSAPQTGEAGQPSGPSSGTSPEGQSAAGDREVPGSNKKSEADAHNEVMGALVMARQNFRLKDKVSAEATADAHATPNAILRSAEVLGALISLEQSHPESKADFQAFYLECSQDAEVITVTRVQCLEKYIISKAPSPDETKALLARTDPRVAKLYLELQP